MNIKSHNNGETGNTSILDSKEYRLGVAGKVWRSGIMRVREYEVGWQNKRGEWKVFRTDSYASTLRMRAIRERQGMKEVTYYRRKRAAAERRLQKIYIRKYEAGNLDLGKIHYPNLMKENPIPKWVEQGKCCSRESRNINGWCKNCNDPCY